MLWIALVVVLIVGAPAASSAQTPAAPAASAARPSASDDAAFLKAMSASLSSMTTLQARFVQRRTLALFEDTLVSEGAFAFQPPDLLRWQLKSPYLSILVFNKGKVGKFEGAPGGALKRIDLGGAEIFNEVLRKVMDVLRGDVKALSADYNMRTEPVAGGATRVILEPKSAALSPYIQEMQLLVEARTYQVTEVTILEGGGDKVVLSFSQTELNKPLDAGLFDLARPKP